MGIEVASYHGSLERPVVKWQAEIMPDDRNVVGVASLRDEWGGAAAIGTLQVLENDKRDLRALRWAKGLRSSSILGGGKNTKQGQDRQQVFDLHIQFDAGTKLSLC